MPNKKKPAPKKQNSIGRSTPRKAPTDAPEAETCFMIMPFGGWFDEYYKQIYKPGIEDAGLKPVRADDLSRSSNIVHDIWRFTKAAKLLLVDMTTRNPNVFYELGLAHALQKPAVLLAETISDVPFDLQPLRVIEYNKNLPSWGETLRSAITRAIQETVAAPLSSVLPTFLETKPESEHRAVSEQDRVLLAIGQEVEQLRREVLRLSDLRARSASSALRSRFLDAFVSSGSRTQPQLFAPEDFRYDFRYDGAMGQLLDTTKDVDNEAEAHGTLIGVVHNSEEK